MACELDFVPEYLQWNARTTYSEGDFLPQHLLYRLTPPDKVVVVPNGQYTGLSCKWGFIINETDLFKVYNPPGVTDFRKALVSSIRSCIKKKNKEDGGLNLGWHKLTCRIAHTPIDCDYSHSEINLRHQIFEDEAESTLIHDETYTSATWRNCSLNTDNRFLKELRKDYRFEVIASFSLPDSI